MTAAGKRARFAPSALKVLVPERPQWQERAACRGIGTETFFGEDEGKRGAKPNAVWAICNVCPVTRECLSYAMRSEAGQGRTDRFGLFAFSTPADRAKLEINELHSFDGRYCNSVRGWVAHRLWDQEPCEECQAKWEQYLETQSLTPIVSYAAAVARRAAQREKAHAYG